MTNKQIPVLVADPSLIANFNRDVTLGVGERFTINVENATDDIQKVSLISAFYDLLSKGDVSELKANGFNVSAAAFDGTAKVGGKDVVFKSGNPTATISAFLRYIRTNPRLLQSLLITTDNEEAYNSSIELTKANPMGNGKTVFIDINQFFMPEQYQSGRVIVDFTREPLEISDDLVMAINIPAGAKMGFNFRF